MKSVEDIRQGKRARIQRDQKWKEKQKQQEQSPQDQQLQQPEKKEDSIQGKAEAFSCYFRTCVN